MAMRKKMRQAPKTAPTEKGATVSKRTTSPMVKCRYAFIMGMVDMEDELLLDVSEPEPISMPSMSILAGKGGEEALTYPRCSALT